LPNLFEQFNGRKNEPGESTAIVLVLASLIQGS